MNNRHIQSFLTVSAAFFAMNAPLQAHASTSCSANATPRVAQCARADVSAPAALKAGQQS
jgi:hypothetical protein